MNEPFFRARIFKKRNPNFWNDRKKIHHTVIFCVLIVVGLLFLDNNRFNNRVIQALMLIFMLIEFALIIGKAGIEKVSDDDGGSFEIFRDEIRFNENKIKIDDIASVNLEVNDYCEKRQSKYISTHDITPLYSQGFDNFLEFTTKNNQNYSIRFQLEYKEHKNQLMPFLYQLITNGVITPEKGTQFLDMTNTADRVFYFNNLKNFQDRQIT